MEPDYNYISLAILHYVNDLRYGTNRIIIILIALTIQHSSDVYFNGSFCLTMLIKTPNHS